MEKVFEIISSTEGKSNNFVTKLQTKHTEDLGILGKKTSQVTFYISLEQEAPVGEKVKLDMSKFRVQEYPFVIKDTGEEIQLKWLHLV